MPRPRTLPDIQATQVNLYPADVERAKKLGINISEVLRDYLHSVVWGESYNSVMSKFKGIPRIWLTKARRQVWKYPSSARAWADILNRKFETQLTEEDILNWLDLG